MRWAAIFRERRKPKNAYEAVHRKPMKSTSLNDAAIHAAGFELQRHFGREGSIYGIKACEEIARIAIVAYQNAQEKDLGPLCSQCGYGLFSANHKDECE